MPDPKKPKLNNAYIAPEGKGVAGGLNFDSLVGNSQINGMVGLNEMRFGLNQTYPLTNNLGLQGGLNYSSYNYPGFQESNTSGSLGVNYSKKLSDNIDLDLSSSIDLNKEGLSPGFRLGLRKTFGEGGPLESMDGNTLNNFILSEDEIDEYKGMAEECHKNADGNCAQGAFDFNVNNVSGQLGTVPLREGLQKAFPEGTNISQTPYSIKSKPRKEKREYLHNQSIDSWEMYNMYKGDLNKQNELGTLLHDHTKGSFKENAENWKKIPIGAIITQGVTRSSWMGNITEKQGSSHTTTVVGFDQDGMPLVYDNGKIQRVNSSGALGRSVPGYSINDIFVPKGYENFTYDNVKNRIEGYNAGLGYKTKEGEPITDASNQYSRSYINDIKNALDENEAAIGQRYGIPKDVMDKIQNRVIGIGAQESNLNNYGDVKEIDKTSESGFKDHDSAGQRWFDNVGMNNVFKPIMKGASDYAKATLDALTPGDEEGKSDWKVEILTEDKLNKEGIEFKYGDDTWKKAYNEMRGQYPKPSFTFKDMEKKDYTSSRGPFKIKNFPESAGKLLKDRDGNPLDLGDLQISGGGSVDELRYGANVAAIHISENYNRMKKRYNEEKGFNLTDDQLIDIATVAYNNNKKSMSDDFVKRFIQRDTLKDGYLTNVKRYEKLYLEQEKLKPGESTKDDGAAENSSMSAEDLERLKKNAAAAEQLMAQPPAQQAYGGPIAYGNGGTISPDSYSYSKLIAPYFDQSEYWKKQSLPTADEQQQMDKHKAMQRMQNRLLEQELENTGPKKNNTMSNQQNLMNALQLMQRQRMATGGNMLPVDPNANMFGGSADQIGGNQPQDPGKFLGLTGSQWGAGTAGALQGVAGSLLPGQVGDMAVQGIGAVHGMIDKDVTAEDQSIMGGARAVGAGVTAVATGGASLAAGADDMVVGTKDAVKHGTEWGQNNAAALDTVGNIAGTAAGGAAGGAANGGGMKGAGQGIANAFGMPGGANAGGTPGIGGGQGMGGQGGIDPQQIMQLAQMFGQQAYGGPIQMAQGGFKPHPMYKDGQMVMANDMATHLSLKEQGYGHEQMKNGGMIKRADGSYSQRGLWDNIRANAGSGKKPTKQMLAQEKKIKMEQGGLMSIENGGTHEQNPMGGVPVGPNASVEEGETIMDLVEGGKFVFSDRKGPKGKKGQTWSDISKRVERKYKDRKGDAAAKRAMDQELLSVAQEQEEQKAKEMAKLQAKMNDLSGQAPAGMPGVPQPGLQQEMLPPQNEMMPPPPDQAGGIPSMPQMGMGGMYYGNGGKLSKFDQAMYNFTHKNKRQPLPQPLPQASTGATAVQMANSAAGLGQNIMTSPQQTGAPITSAVPNPGAAVGLPNKYSLDSTVGINPMMPMGYGGKVKKKYGMGGPVMYPGGGMIPYGGGGRMQYGYGGSLNIPQEDIDYIEQMIDFELAHGSEKGTGLSYGAWSDNNASDRDSAIEFIYNKYVTPNKDLPVELRKRAADMHLNSEDPRASLMVAAGVITPAEKLKLYNVKNPKTGKGMINPDDLDKLWGENKDKVEAKYSDPKFVEDFDKEKHRSYSGLGDMYKNSQKYRIDMWNPKAANYRNPANYKNTDYDGGQPTVGTAQFGTKAQDTKQSLNTALGMDQASKDKTAAELDQVKADMQADASVPDFLQGDFDQDPNKPKGFLGKDIDGNPAWIGGEAPDGAMAMDPNDPNDPRNSSEFQGIPFRNPNDPNAPGNNPNEYTGDWNYGYEKPKYVDPLTGQEIDYDPYDTDNQQPADNLELADQMFDREGRTEAEQRALGDKIVKNNPTMPDVYPGQNIFDMMQNSNVGEQEVNTDFLEGDFANQTSMGEQPTQPQGEPFSADMSGILGLDDNQFVNPQNPGDNTQVPFMTPEQLEAQKQKELLAKRAANGENPDGTLNMQQYKDRGFFKDEEVEGSDYNPNVGRYKPMTYEEEMAKLDAEALAREQEAANKKRIRNRNLGIGAGALANSAGDIYNLVQGLKKPEEIKYDRVNPELINLHNQRLMQRNQAAGTIGNVREGMRRSGSISDMIAAQSAVGDKLGQGLAKSYLDEEVTNTGITNKAEAYNQQVDMREQIANQQAKAKQRLLVEEGLHGIGKNTAGAMLDVRKSNQVDTNNANQINAMNAMFKDFDWDALGTMLKFTGNNYNKKDPAKKTKPTNTSGEGGN